MIRSLRLINFKPFENQLLELRALTLLSGLNNTGKSSVLQSLLLLRQSYQQGLLPNAGLALNGDLVRIGTAEDALFQGAGKEDSIGFDILCENSIEGKWCFKCDREFDVMNLASFNANQDIYKLSLFNDDFHYLHAERMGQGSFNEMSGYQVKRLQQLGSKGEYTAHFLSVYRDKDIPNPELRHPKTKWWNLSSQVEAWIGEVCPGTRLKIAPRPDVDLMNSQYLYGDSNAYRATNVGFGITYTLPIIVAVLASPPGSLIMIENPEAHLHPKGQSKLGELFALAASCGVQVVIETHSDHLLNGIRLAVRGQKIDANNVQLNYFQRKINQGMPFTEIVSPHIDRNGRIDKWPDGFFDEWDQSLEALLEPVGD